MNILVKYQKTPHLSFSKGYISDDKTLIDNNHFKNMKVVVDIEQS